MLPLLPDHSHAFIDEVLDVLEGVLERKESLILLRNALLTNLSCDDEAEVLVFIIERHLTEPLILLDMCEEPLRRTLVREL